MQRKKLREVADESRFDFGESDTAVEEFFEGGGFSFGDTAWNDQVEITQVGGDVVREAVGSDPTSDVHADGGEFFFGCG